MFGLERNEKLVKKTPKKKMLINTTNPIQIILLKGRKENTRFTWKTLERGEKTTIVFLLFSLTMEVTKENNFYGL